MKLFVVAAVGAFLVGCAVLLYTGDGHFTDNGIFAYSRRYVIDLGPIDLSKPRSYSYSLSGLPHAEMAVVIRIFEETKNTWSWEGGKRDYPAVVRVQLKNDKDQVVISEEGPLNSWSREYGVLDNISELSRAGESREIPLPGGGTQGQLVGVKASGGWGTHFNSERSETYKLSVDVLESSLNRPARMMIVGWDR